MTKGEAEMQHNMGAGTGDAFKSMNGAGNSKESNGNRRKRNTLSFFRSQVLIKSPSLKSVFREKRQAEMTTPEMPTLQMPAGTVGENVETVFERIKQTFSRIIDTTKDMFQRVRNAMQGQSNDKAMQGQ